MATKKTVHRTRQSEVYLKKISAGLFVLSFMIITLCVMRLEASTYQRVMYITFDSFFVFVVVAALQRIVARILITYEEMDGGQG